MKKWLLAALILVLFINPGKAEPTENIKTALLLIDIQQFYFPGENNPGLVGAEAASEKAGKLLDLFRDNNKLVVHVSHKTSKGFEIHQNVKPLPDEKVFTKTEINCFNGTDLLDYFQANGVNRIVFAGMQTHMCLEAAVRAAHDFGFDCIVVEDACATRDLEYNGRTIKAADIHAGTLESLVYGGYATVVDFQGLVGDLENIF